MLRLAGKPVFGWTILFAERFKLPDDDIKILLRAMMNGPDSFNLIQSKTLNRSNLGNNAYNLCFEYACYIAGEIKLLMASLNDLPDEPEDSDDQFVKFIWLERKYLKGYGFWQRGDVSQGWNEWNFIYLQPQLTPQIIALIISIRIHETLDMLQRGFFARAADKFEKILKEKRQQMDLFTLHNLLGPLSICYMCIGQFVDATNTHADIDKLLAVFNSHHLNVLAIRRKVMYLIEKDSFDIAQNMINEALQIQNISKSRRALILELQFEIAVLMHNVKEAETLLTSMKQLIEQEPISVGTLNIIEEETELLLRQNRPDDALEKVKQILDEANQRGDVFAEIIGKTFLARSFYLKGNFPSALQILEDIIPVAIDLRYGAPLVDLYFHAAGIAWHAKRLDNVNEYLSQALNLSRRYGLKVRSKCFAYLTALISSSQSTARPLLEVIIISENGAEVDYLLNVYGFSNRNEYTLESDELQHHLEERSICNFIRKNYGLYWFSREKIMVTNSPTHGVKNIEFKNNILFQKILEKFAQSKEGVTNEDIHALDSKVYYHPLKHGGKVRATIHRFRKALESYGIDIIYNRTDAKLFLSNTLNVYFVSAIT